MALLPLAIYNYYFYLATMKLTFLLLFLPLIATAQKARVLHYKQATTTDTAFSVASGLVSIDTAITINNNKYTATYTGQYSLPMKGYKYDTYTLANGWSAIVTRFGNDELEALTVDEGSTVETFYFR